MSSSARTLGPPTMLGLASPAVGVAATSSSKASGRTAAAAAAAASHLNTGLLLASGPGQTRRALLAPGAQPQTSGSSDLVGVKSASPAGAGMPRGADSNLQLTALRTPRQI